MANAMGLLLGPLSSALSSRFSCRSMVVVGGVLIAAGWCITGYMPRIEYMFITYGLLAGIGKSLAYTPSIVMVGKWFNRRRSLANGITLSGVGVGTFAFAPLLEALLTKYSFSGTMLIMGGVMLNVSVCGLFFLPVPSKITTRKKQTVLINGNCEEMSTKKCDANSNNYFQHEQAMNTNGNMKDSNSISSSKSVPAKEASYVPASKFVLKDYIDYTLLKNLSFISVGISVLLAPLGQSPAFMMLPSLAAQNNIPAQKSAFLLSITGIADIIGRLTFGAICDITYLRNNRKYVYVASIFISGVASGVCGFAHTYWHFATYAVVFGLFGGSYHALTPVILVDLLGADKLSSSFGIALLFQGIGYLVGPPLAGLISDAMGGYQSAFFFAGIASVLSSIIMNVPSIKPCWDRCIKQQHLKVTEQQRENVIVDAREITNTNIDGNPVCISYVSNSETLKGCRSVTSTNGHDTLGYV
ncbi:monocarboxylate transporter 12-like isoform X1 [Dreissena polymorpha]|nr:monocarboxylate transporter 12-like isoform X1 [Dreissena polymorpha]